MVRVCACPLHVAEGDDPPVGSELRALASRRVVVVSAALDDRRICVHG